jgi:hypothetical protein
MGTLGRQRLLAHESAANDALTQYRLQALKALGDYGALRGKAAIDGHDAYRQALQDSRDGVFAKLPGAAQALLQPHLDRQHHEDLHFGMAHRGQQDKEWATQSALDSLEADKREAVLRPGDLNLLQRLAERSDAEWLKIGQREGWLDDLVLRNAERSKADLIGRVVLTQLKDGDHAGARQTWEFAQNHVDPQSMIDAMRTKQIPGREQPYDGGNPMLGDNANVRPQDVQLNGAAGPGGQQFVQAQMPASEQNDTSPMEVQFTQPRPENGVMTKGDIAKSHQLNRRNRPRGQRGILHRHLVEKQGRRQGPKSLHKRNIRRKKKQKPTSTQAAWQQSIRILRTISITLRAKVSTTENTTVKVGA